MTTEPAIFASGLSKAYGDLVVLDHIDLHVPAGSVFGLLGPNGAGKTTAVQILSTLIAADGGDVRIFGLQLDTEAAAVRSMIGVTGQFSAVDGLLTGAENMRLMADLLHLDRRTGTARTDRLLDRFDLVEAARKPASTYSGGMRRKLDLAMTLMGTPRLIFLDEPTTGLDPRSRREVWDIIGDLVADGTTVFLTTQYLDEADRLADRVAVLDGGRIVAAGSPSELKRSVPGGHITLQMQDANALTAAGALLAAAVRNDDALSLDVPSDGSLASLRQLLDQLDRAGVAVESLSVRTPDLDDVFLALTGRAPELEVAQ